MVVTIIFFSLDQAYLQPKVAPSRVRGQNQMQGQKTGNLKIITQQIRHAIK